MLRHAHVIPNIGPDCKNNDPRTWYLVAYFDGRGICFVVSGCKSKEDAYDAARWFNRMEREAAKHK